MDIFFTDPNDIPLPPNEVRIRDFRAEPWKDGQKIRVYLETDPSLKKPSAELTLIDPQDKIISNISIVESMTNKIEVNMHLRSAPIAGQYKLQVILYFDELESESDPDQAPQFSHLETDKAQLSFYYELASE